MLLIPLLLTACLPEDAPGIAPETVSSDLVDDVPCEFLKGPPDLPAAEPTPAFRYIEEFDLLAAEVGSPFQLLDRSDYEAFRGSMKFNEYGQLTGYRYEVLRDALPAAEYQRAMDMIGRRPKDHEDYDCVKHGSCKRAAGYICTSSC